MKTNPQKGAYPTWSDLLAILGIYLVAMLAFNLGGGLLLRFGIASQGPVGARLRADIPQHDLLCAVRQAAARRAGRKTAPVRFRKTDPALVLWGVITVLATTLVIEPLLELFPSRWLEWLGDQMKLGGWMMLTTVVVAPILEEILFRGILQESLTRKYGPWRGILIASAIFGIVHGIPQQALNAFFRRRDDRIHLLQDPIADPLYTDPCAEQRRLLFRLDAQRRKDRLHEGDVRGANGVTMCCTPRPASSCCWPSPASYARSGGIATWRFRRRKRPKTGKVFGKNDNISPQ